METQAMAGHLLRRLHQVSTQTFARRVQGAGYDLTPVQFAALDAIQHNPGADQARIAALIAYDKATIGGVIERLEQKGLVTRAISKRDRRAREINLTTEGILTLQDMMPIVRDLQSEILSGLSPEERVNFLDLASKLLDPSLSQDLERTANV